MSEKRKWNEKSKKTAVITGLFALMFVVGAANYALSKEEKLPAEETLAETAESMTLEEDAFEVFKNERAISRQQQLSFDLGHTAQGIDHHRDAGGIHKGNLLKIQYTDPWVICLDLCG